MTSVEELKNALKETLEQKGVLNQIKAMMRKEIYDSIENDDNPKPQLSKENLIINELIKDYLKYNNYSNSSYVFQSETGQPKDIYDRNSLSKELNIIEDESNKQKPLLYSILFGLKNQDINLVPFPPHEAFQFLYENVLCLPKLGRSPENHAS